MERQTVLPDGEFGDLRSRFARAINLTIAGGAKHYERERHLQRLVCHGDRTPPQNPASESMRIIRKLYSAIRHERQLGKAGDRAYDINRHIGLRQALRAELKILRKLKTGR